MKNQECRIVQTMSREELEQTSGGLMGLVLTFMGWYFYESFDNLSATYDSLKKGWDSSLN